MIFQAVHSTLQKEQNRDISCSSSLQSTSHHFYSCSQQKEMPTRLQAIQLYGGSVHRLRGMEQMPPIGQASFSVSRHHCIVSVNHHHPRLPSSTKWALQRTGVHRHYELLPQGLATWRQAPTFHTSVKEHGATAGDTSFLVPWMKFRIKGISHSLT